MKSLHLWKPSSIQVQNFISFDISMSGKLSQEQKLSCTALVISTSQKLVLRPLLSARPGCTLAKVAWSPGSSHLHQNPGKRCIHKGLLRQLKDRERGLQQPSSCPLGKLSVWWLGSQGCRTEIPIWANHHHTTGATRERHGREITTRQGLDRVMEYCLCKGELPIVALGLQFTVVGETQLTTALEMFYCSGLAAVVDAVAGLAAVGCQISI